MVVPPSLKSVVFVTVVIGIFGLAQGAERTSDQNKVRERGTGLSLWIDQNQVKLFSGLYIIIILTNS